MGATSAERQRRYRAHKRGDHSLCDPMRCESDSGTPVTGVTRNAETRGQRLWREMAGDSQVGGVRALVEEACRIADRLDRLDAILSGADEGWLRLRVNEDGTEVTVTLDRALAESRAQAVVLKQIVSELRQSAGKAQQPEREASGSDELAKRREDRRAAAGL